MRRKFLINPSSRRRAAAKLLPGLEAKFKRSAGGFDFVLTSSRQDTIAQTRRALGDGVEQIVVVGGDGTLNAVINGFFDGEKKLGDACVVAAEAGTGSDYYKTITWHWRGDWTETVTRFEARPVDVGRIEYLGTRAASVCFLNVASIGIGAAVVEKKNRGSGWVPPALSYLVPTLTSLFTYRPRRVHVALDGKTREIELMNLFLAKGIFAGGGMRLGGKVTLDDGDFDVTLIERMGLVENLSKVPRLYGRGLEPGKKIERVIAQRIEVSAAEPMPVEFDGEVEGTTDIRVTVRPRAIRICFPKEEETA